MDLMMSVLLHHVVAGLALLVLLMLSEYFG